MISTDTDAEIITNMKDLLDELNLQRVEPVCFVVLFFMGFLTRILLIDLVLVGLILRRPLPVLSFTRIKL